MIIRSTPASLGKLLRPWRKNGDSIGFVPTMGALHRGHNKLIHRARRENDRVVVSIFVNPAQFGPKEDYTRYPRPRRQDEAACRQAHVDALYRPTPRIMYPHGPRTRIDPGPIANILCGKHRPGHFSGVATIVVKLLEQIQPHALYLGEKDYQQLVIMRRVAADLDIPVKIIGVPTVRETDGLALSSRNAYLSARERSEASGLIQALRKAKIDSRTRGASVASVRANLHLRLRKISRARLEYAEIVDAHTLQSAGSLKGNLRILAAIWFGKTRVIDNIALKV